ISGGRAWGKGRAPRRGVRLGPGLTFEEGVYGDGPARALAGLGVHDAVLEARLEHRLGLDEDAAELALLEARAGLDGAEEALVVEVPVAEVPAERPAGHELSVEPFVGVHVVHGDRDEVAERAPVEV